MVVEERLTPVGPNIHANKAGYEEIADTFEAIVDPRSHVLRHSDRAAEQDGIVLLSSGWTGEWGCPGQPSVALTAGASTSYHVFMAKKMLPARFEESEIEQIRAQAALEGRSLQDYVHDLLMNAVNARAQRRHEVLERVLRVSEGLNKRLAQ